eukprot:scaffold620_cov386-Prasinococcus_capsulatus_cf.AAC.12
MSIAPRSGFVYACRDRSDFPFPVCQTSGSPTFATLAAAERGLIEDEPFTLNLRYTGSIA